MQTDIVGQTDAPLAVQPIGESVTESLIRIALDKGLNPSELYAILDKERVVRALQAYNRAKGDFLERCPRIVEKRIGGGLTKGGKEFKFLYADLGDVVEQAFPALRVLGFAWDFSMVVLADGKQYQRCYLRHSGGYVHQADVPYLPDVGGHMNAVQQVGSGLSYSQRYALLQALGLPTSKEDANRAPSASPITPEQVFMLEKLAAEVGADVPRFLGYMQVMSLSEITDYAKAVAALEAKRREK